MKVFMSGVMLVVMSISLYFSNALQPEVVNDALGEVQIVVIDEKGNEVIHDSLTFTEDDTLLSLLESHYEVTTQKGFTQLPDSTVILGINDVQTNFESTFIRILVDGYLYDRNGDLVEKVNHISVVGIDMLPLIDGNTYTFEYASVNGR
ncbi:MAG: hypothetical protein ACLFRI_01905 [Candidatus Izemoplasmataceae bacterium]